MVDLVKIRKKAKKKESPGLTPEANDVDRAGHVSEANESPRASLEREHEPGPEPGEREPGEHERESKLERFREEAGRRRDVQVTEAVRIDSARLQLLTFTIAGEQYAIDIEHIVEIVTPREITRVPNAEVSIVGIISLRGTIVTLIDVRAQLHHAPVTKRDADTRIIVVSHRGETLGFEVDRLSRVVDVEPTAIEPHPVVHASEQSEAIRGVFRHANALTILLDLDKLLDAQTPTYGTNV